VGSKVSLQPLLADGPATPRQLVKAEVLKSSSLGPVLGKPVAISASLSQRSCGDAGATFVDAALVSGGTGGTDEVDEPKTQSKVRSAVLSGLKDGSLDKLAAEAADRTAPEKPEKAPDEGLTGLEWARKYGSGPDQVETIDSDWANQVLSELQTNPARDRDPAQGLTGLAWAKLQSSDAVVNDEDQQAAQELLTFSKGAGKNSSEEVHSMYGSDGNGEQQTGVKKGLSRQSSVLSANKETTGTQRWASTAVQTGSGTFRADLFDSEASHAGERKIACCLPGRRRRGP